MNAWYDINSLDRVGTKEEDNYSKNDIDANYNKISEMIKKEIT